MQTPWFPDLRADDFAPDAYVGGEIALPWVLAAYPRGFFPWPMEGEPLAWWCPRVRMLFEPGGLHVSRSLGRTLRRGRYRVTLDSAFDAVLARCRDKRGPEREGTWITRDIGMVYNELFEMGLAHSAETWEGDRLVGGVYGISLGGVFFGESMFADATDASKVALATLMAQLDAWDFDLFDCQVPNPHLVSLGGKHVRRSVFLARLARSLQRPTRVGRWSLEAGTRKSAPQAL